MKAFTGGINIDQRLKVRSPNQYSGTTPDILNKEDVLVTDKPQGYQDVIKQNQAYRHIHQYTYSMKILTPIVTAVMLYDDRRPTVAEVRRGFNLILSKLDDAVKKIMIKLNYNPEDKDNLWVKNEIEAHIIDMITQVWKINKTLSTPLIDATLEQIIHHHQYIEIEQQENQNIRVDMFKLMSKIIQHINQYPLFLQNSTEITEYIVQSIKDITNNTYKELYKEELSSKDKTYTYSCLLKEITAIYMQVWLVEHLSFNNAISSLDSEGVKRAKTENNRRWKFHLDRINRNFKDGVDKVINMTKILVNNQ